MPLIVVEFYGLARQRAGRAELQLEAATIGMVLAAADAACPGLRALGDNGLSPEYRLSVGESSSPTNWPNRFMKAITSHPRRGCGGLKSRRVSAQIGSKPVQNEPKWS